MNNYQENSCLYAKHALSGTGYLAFKNIPGLLKKYTPGKKTLDYGCGSGRSSRFLKDLGLVVEGVDISQDMLKEARKIDNSIPYIAIDSANIPRPPKNYDLVFSSLVLFEISSKKELLTIFTEIHRVLKDDGFFIIVTGSIEMYDHHWLTLGVDFEENKNLQSGSVAKVLLKDINLELYDYFWTDHDYKEIIQESRFQLLEKQFPLGDNQDGYQWVSETHASPYVIYVLKKWNITLPSCLNDKADYHIKAHRYLY